MLYETPANTDRLTQFKTGLVLINFLPVSRLVTKTKKGNNTWIRIYTSDIPDIFVYPRHKSVWVGFLDIRPFSMWG